MSGVKETEVVPSSQRATDLLIAWSQGDRAALDDLVLLVHAELRRLAHREMSREQRRHTLQTTALMNEAYLRLIDLRRIEWRDRSHFFRMCARLMRRVLVDYGRARRSRKRGGAEQRISIEEARPAVADRPVDVLALDEALHKLSEIDARQSQIVELRFFGGLSIEETAKALDISPETVKRAWRAAKMWLLRELAGVKR